MKRSFYILMILLVFTAAAFAQSQENQQTTQPSSIPVPEGAQVTTEMAMNHDQLMSQLDLMTAFAPPSVGQLDINALRLAFDPIKYVQYAQMNYKSGDTPDKLIAFFESKIGGRRIIYDIGSLPGAGLIMIATQDGGYFAAMINTPAPGSSKDDTEGSIQAFRIFGSPNIEQLVKAAMPIILKSNVGILSKGTKPATKTSPTTKPTTNKRR